MLTPVVKGEKRKKVREQKSEMKGVVGAGIRIKDYNSSDRKLVLRSHFSLLVQVKPRYLKESTV